MADGYARATGKPGVAIIITGPGITNVATPVGEAYADYCAQVPRIWPTFKRYWSRDQLTISSRLVLRVFSETIWFLLCLVLFEALEHLRLGWSGAEFTLPNFFTWPW